jgi:hypothetical protein
MGERIAFDDVLPALDLLNRSYNPAYYAIRHPQQKGRMP